MVLQVQSLPQENLQIPENIFQVPLPFFFRKISFSTRKLFTSRILETIFHACFEMRFPVSFSLTSQAFLQLSIYTASLQGIGNILDFRAFKILRAPRSGSRSPLPPFFNPIGMSIRMRGSICSYFFIKKSIRN